MLKKSILTLFCALSFAFSQDFITLKGKIEAKNTLIEVFSYKCIHCYNHQRFGTLEALKEKIPNLSYEIYPISIADVKFGTLLNELFAYAISADRKNQKDASYQDSLAHRLAKAYFEKYFLMNKKGQVVATKDFEDEKSFLQNGLNVLKISEKELKNFIQTKEAKELLERFEWANEVAKNYGTPAFIVNGSYQIKPEAIDSFESLLRIIEELKNK
ncbi:thioredoxin domain-containing protein [Campylobacter vulpis]|uniref:Thiol n=1 Tax=Campylobacter vulpis TaxID=1655500 RepID=A0A2G4R0D6_9BACT|nr:thioredoxin domain-containing protein [Campylobacter vulpis]MBS4236048.1 thiol:disulfide interchange protein DsbA/DsbL [Campylobacter vulpis]MBS4240784.1 thiol:disulfide interchange protein DsbA/DsbL [Campylobacter vulpis]MBS4253088.1 thiol:disulfide interchange protein DsbA/DsbL [Campylobacter vulpis]MBS4275619.1 thiol:disulfide interchange protein DsbA/DsbL [Campylobacter vulpis]MBS4281629.1 thiol:disulfide interchange protein DsbA/DsbL [Campylobacter vulpis]